MKFTINELAVDSVTVEYEDKSTASIPIRKGMSKNEIVETVSLWHNPVEPFEKVADIPVAKGETHEFTKVTQDENVSYQVARAHHYPAIGNQLDALYWERQGDDTQRKAYDVRIKNVKDTITKEKTYKRSELDNLLD
tara:strand:- start:1099 stop:1509 length:411 start_codon:yes stop_codon:yes gene_type:complete